VSLPVVDVLGSSDRYERVFGYFRVLIEETEDRVTAVMLEHLGDARLALRPGPRRPAS